MSYSVLSFTPNVTSEYNIENVLWKAELNIPFSHSSMIVDIIKTNIKLNENRMLLSQWKSVLDNLKVKYEYELDDKYYKKILIVEYETVGYHIDLYACDIRTQYYCVEVQSELILSLLYILDIKKNEKLNPKFLQNKIMLAEEKLDQNVTVNKSTLNILNQLDRLCTICLDYEIDIACNISQRN